MLLLQGRGLQKTSNKRTFCYFAITPEIKSDHKQTCYNLVSTIRLWYKTVDFLQFVSPKTLQQQIQLGFLTHTDQTDLLAQFMLDHVKLCDHCMYICMARLNKRVTEPVFSIAQNQNVLLTDISGRIHPDPVKQFYQLKLQEQQQATQKLLQQQQQQQQQQPMQQMPTVQNQFLQQLPAQQQPVQQQQMQQHLPLMQQMVPHHFWHLHHFIVQIHPQFVVPVMQPVYAQSCNNTTSHQVPQQPVKQHTVPS